MTWEVIVTGQATPYGVPMTRFGEQLRHWRTTRRYSQLALATAADVSSRHLSYLETGKSRPSREMVIHLSRVLEIPLRVQNDMLVAAGFAPAYGETPLGSSAMERVRATIQHILDVHEPALAVAVDGAYDVVAANDPTTTVVGALVAPDSAAVGPSLNTMRLLFHPDGIRHAVANWTDAATAVLRRLLLDVVHRPTDERLSDLLDEVMSYPGVSSLPQRTESVGAGDLLVPMDIAVGGRRVRLLTTIATIGAPHDVTLEELHLETLWPADDASRAALEEMVGA